MINSELPAIIADPYIDTGEGPAPGMHEVTILAGMPSDDAPVIALGHAEQDAVSKSLPIVLYVPSI